MTETMLEIKARPERKPIQFKVDGKVYSFKDVEGVPLIERHGLVKMARRMAGIGEIGQEDVSDEDFQKSVSEIGALFSLLVIESNTLDATLSDEQKLEVIQYFFEQRAAQNKPPKKKRAKKTASISPANSSVSTVEV